MKIHFTTKDLLAPIIIVITLCLACISPPSRAQTPNSFVTTWKTDNSGTSDNNQITIPTTGSGYHYNVYWESLSDASSQGSIAGATGNLTITFPAQGTYRVEISGDFPRIFFNNEGDKQKILSVTQWGNIRWTSMEGAFRGAANLQINAVDAPDLSGVVRMGSMFQGAAVMNSPIGHWDVSHIQQMYAMFHGASAFNQDLSNWNVSQVNNMGDMFNNASSFNGNIGNWDVSSVTNMSNMFANAAAFNQPLNNWNVSKASSMVNMFNRATRFNGNVGSWNVSSVVNMRSMFLDAGAFNQNLSNWDVSKVSDMSGMFLNAGSFNGNIGNWNVSAVTNMSGMFQDAAAFNQDLNWNPSKVSDMSAMFLRASSFNGNITNWNVQEVTTMSGMFQGATVFNRDLNWNVSKVTSMLNMFSSARAFNGNIGSWNVSAVTNMVAMFRGATAFNQQLNNWNVSKVNNMTDMFDRASSFNGNISNWDVSAVTTMAGMFQEATVFNQDLGSWNVSKVTDMFGMFNGARAFNRNLNNWNVSEVTTMYTMFGGARNFNGNISSWNVYRMKNMSSMFSGASSFNGDIVNWNVSAVTNMANMFNSASSFNGEIGGWDVSKVTYMNGMFLGASSFNGNINNWDVSSVEDMGAMFANAGNFNVNLGDWNVSAVTNMENMLTYAGLSQPNYDSTLIGWATRGNLKPGVILNAHGLTYCLGTDARQKLVDEYGWTITGDVRQCDDGISPSEGNILYVDRNVVAGDSSGNSWANALPELADALQWARTRWGLTGTNAGWNAENPLKIYVAKGTYLPKYRAGGELSADSDRNNAFVMTPCTQLYGGFDPVNNITELTHRRILPTLTPGVAGSGNGTILSGNIGEPTIAEDNTYHVVITAGSEINNVFLMDGFTIRDGYADQPEVTDEYSQLVSNAFGAGWYNVMASPRLNQVAIINNFAYNAPGIFNLAGNPAITSLIISGNRTTGYGGGMMNYLPSASLTNVIFSGNASIAGGAVYNWQSNPVMTNVTISGNRPDAIDNEGSFPVINNSIIWGNQGGINDEGEEESTTTISNSIVQGGFQGVAIIDKDPLWVHAPNHTAAPFTNGNYGLMAGSPAINAGDQLTNIEGHLVQAGNTDLSGNDRIRNGRIDLGAYEVSCSITLAGDGTQTTRLLAPGRNYLYDACSLFAIVEPTGQDNPVSGLITAKSWTKDGIVSFQNARYLRRHYDLAPASNASNATADITLFFKQADFDAYNASYGTANGSQLPTGPAAALPGNIRIAQFSGDYEVNGQSITYEGRPNYIIPKLVNWNATHSVWEVTFAVSRFSGFFLTGQNDQALPVTLIAFTAEKQEHVELNWQTSGESNSSHFEIQRSTDSRQFETIGEVKAHGESTKTESYHHTDTTPPVRSIVYYRLKMVDYDGSFAYSRIVAVKADPQPRNLVVNLYPNPSKGQVCIEAAGAQPLKVTAYALSGREIPITNRSISPGKSELDFSGQPGGIYMLVIHLQDQVLVKKLVIQ